MPNPEHRQEFPHWKPRGKGMMMGWIEPRFGRNLAYTEAMQGRTLVHFQIVLGSKRGGITYVYRIYVSFVEGVHVAIWQKAIGEKGKKDEFWERQELIA